MTQMDTHLSNYPNQFIEYEGEEGEIFQRYFKKGIVYKVKQQRPYCMKGSRPLQEKSSSSSSSSCSTQQATATPTATLS